MANDTNWSVDESEAKIQKILKTYRTVASAVIESGATDFKSQLRVSGFTSDNTSGHRWTNLTLDWEDLTDIDFSYCDLRGTTFYKAHVSGCKFFGAIVDPDALIDAIGLDPSAFLKRTLFTGRDEKIAGAVQLEDGRVFSWCPYGGARIWEIKGFTNAFWPKDDLQVDGALQLNNGNILTWGSNPDLAIWLPDGSIKKELKSHVDVVIGAIEMSDGQIATWSADKTIRIWSVEGLFLSVLTGHAGKILGLIQLSSGHLASWGADNRIAIWDPRTGQSDWLIGHTAPVRNVIELEPGKIVSWARDDTERHWTFDLINLGSKSTRKPADRSRLPNNDAPEPGTCVVYFPNREHGKTRKRNGGYLSWGWGGTPSIMMDDLHVVSILVGHSKMVRGAIELSNGNILSWSDDRTLRIWSEHGREFVVLSGHSDSVVGAIELSDGRIMSWDRNQTWILWDLDNSPEVLSVFRQKEDRSERVDE